MIQFLDALAVFFIVAMGLVGFRRGLVEEMGRLIGLIFATIFALKLYIGLGSFLISWVPIDVWVLFVLSFIIIFSAILLFARMITKLIHFLFLSKKYKTSKSGDGNYIWTCEGSFGHHDIFLDD